MTRQPFSTFDLVLLALLAATTVAGTLVFRLPLRVYGKSELVIVMFLVLARVLVPRPGAATLVSTAAGFMHSALGGGEGMLLALPHWFAGGLAVDVVLHGAPPRPGAARLCAAGCVSSIACALSKLPVFVTHHGGGRHVLMLMVVTHAAFGTIGALGSNALLRALEWRGLTRAIAARRGGE